MTMSIWVMSTKMSQPLPFWPRAIIWCGTFFSVECLSFLVLLSMFVIRKDASAAWGIKDAGWPRLCSNILDLPQAAHLELHAGLRCLLSMQLRSRPNLILNLSTKTCVAILNDIYSKTKRNGFLLAVSDSRWCVPDKYRCDRQEPYLLQGHEI